jgi:CBS domain-containing protein
MDESNLIPDRIAATLRQYPPFSMMPAEATDSLATQAHVRVLVAEERVWQQGDPPGDSLYVLVRGRVEYHISRDGQNELVAVRDEGDLLGLTPLLRSQPVRTTAQVVEDSVLYGLPWQPIQRLLAKHDDARHYVNRHLFWTTRLGGESTTVPAPDDDVINGRAKNILQAHLAGGRVIQPRALERLLTCSPTTSIHDAAKLMAKRRVPSVLVVDTHRRPLGIVTQSAIVKQVVAADTPREASVEGVMASPVITVSALSSATAAILLMLRERIGQVCVTEDGTPDTPALDVFTNKDLLAQSGHHPAGLLREFRHARTVARLRELCDEIEQIIGSYLEAGVSAIFLGQICAELYDELIQRLLEMSTDELAKAGVKLPKISWAWLSVGSDGRREQTLRTDMDNALVFAASDSPARDEAHREVFLQLAAAVIAKMVECGFARCQGGGMASNPRWCRTDREWATELEEMASRSENTPLFRGIVLYDMRFVAGDAPLVRPLRQAIIDSVRSNPWLQRRLADLVIETPPPLNFWGKFIIEKRGDRAGEFDLKGRALAPLRDAARLLALKHQQTRRYSTGGRWEDLQRHVPALADLAKVAREAYDVLLALRLTTALTRQDSGRFVDPSKLSKLEKARLAQAFDVVRMVQTHVRLAFNLEIR